MAGTSGTRERYEIKDLDFSKFLTGMGPGSPTPTPESLTEPPPQIPQFMRPNPETGYPGAFAWTGAWEKSPAEMAGPGPAGPWEDQPYTGRPMESYLLPPAAVQATAARPSAPALPLSPEDQIRKILEGSAKTAAEKNEWLAERQLLGPSGPGGMTQRDYEEGRRPRESPFPRDMFTNMPEVPGKTFVGAWTDPSGKIQPLFEPKKGAGADFMDTVQPLIDEYQRRVQSSMNPPTGMGVEDVNKRTRDYYMLEAFGTHFGKLMDKILAAGKAPSEIGKAESEATRNLAEAGRVQLAPNVYVGPGEMGSFAIPPGGKPQQFATGGPQEKITPEEATRKQIWNTQMAGEYHALAQALTPEQEARSLARIQALRQEMGLSQPQTPQQKISKADFYTKAKAMKYSQAQIDAEWNKLVQKGTGIQ